MPSLRRSSRIATGGQTPLVKDKADARTKRTRQSHAVSGVQDALDATHKKRQRSDKSDEMPIPIPNVEEGRPPRRLSAVPPTPPRSILKLSATTSPNDDHPGKRVQFSPLPKTQKSGHCEQISLKRSTRAQGKSVSNDDESQFAHTNASHRPFQHKSSSPQVQLPRVSSRRDLLGNCISVCGSNASPTASMQVLQEAPNGDHHHDIVTPPKTLIPPGSPPCSPTLQSTLPSPPCSPLVRPEHGAAVPHSSAPRTNPCVAPSPPGSPLLAMYDSDQIPANHAPLGAPFRMARRASISPSPSPLPSRGRAPPRRLSAPSSSKSPPASCASKDVGQHSSSHLSLAVKLPQSWAALEEQFVGVCAVLPVLRARSRRPTVDVVCSNVSQITGRRCTVESIAQMVYVCPEVISVEAGPSQLSARPVVLHVSQGGSKAASAVFSKSLKKLYLSLSADSMDPQIPQALLPPAHDSTAKRQLPMGKATHPQASNVSSQDSKPACLPEDSEALPSWAEESVPEGISMQAVWRVRCREAAITAANTPAVLAMKHRAKTLGYVKRLFDTVQTMARTHSAFPFAKLVETLVDGSKVTHASSYAEVEAGLKLLAEEVPEWCRLTTSSFTGAFTFKVNRHVDMNVVRSKLSQLSEVVHPEARRLSFSKESMARLGMA